LDIHGGGTMQRAVLRKAAFAFLLAALGLCWGIAAAAAEGEGEGEGEAPRQVPTTDAAGVPFVGSEACASCHEAQHALWLDSHHRHAMEPMSEESVRGDFDGASLERGGESLSFHRENGRYVVRATGADGSSSETELLYTFGWEPLQQYLVAGPGGRLQAFDVAWDTVAGRWFALYPGQDLRPGDPMHWTGLQQTWNFMCADCHSTALDRNYDSASDSFATTWSEVTLGCESCHGAGGAHVAWAGRGEAERAGDLAKGLRVLFPATPGAWVFGDEAPIAHWEGEPRQQPEIAACGPCHAHRRVIAEALGAHQSLFDVYLPSLLDAGLYRPDGRQEAEVYILGSFLQSRMAAAGVTCSDCHDPHSGALKAEGNALCAQCHQPAVFDTREHHRHEPGTEAAACVSCHMPADLYMVVDARRDHGFHVPGAALAAVPGVVDACAGCHEADAWQQASAAGWWPGREGLERGGPDLERAVALMLGRSQGIDAAAALAELAGDGAQPAIFRATALAGLAQNPQASAMAALAAGLRDGDPLLRLGAVRGTAALPLADRYHALRPLFDDPVKAVRLEVAQALGDVPLAQLPPAEAEALGRLFDEMLAAERLFLDRPESHYNIANHLASQGDFLGAERAFRTAIARDPHFVPAWVNLSELQRASGSDSLGLATLRRGLAVVPDSAPLHYALGLALYRQGDPAAALDALAEAARLEPGTARYPYALALAQRQAGERAAAVATLAAALSLSPNDRSLLFALVSYLDEDGDRRAALEHARHLAALEPANPEVAALVRRLGG